MTIRIAARLRPFSHLPGTCCLLPHTHLNMQIFPARVDALLFSLDWDIAGPVQDFTVEMDLEQQQIVVFGRTKHGYMRYRLRRNMEGNGVLVIVDKTPKDTIRCHLSLHNQTHSLSRGETLLIPSLFGEDLYRNNLKNREFDKEAPQNICPEDKTIAERQGMSEDKNFEVKPMPSKTDFSSCFGRPQLFPERLSLGMHKAQDWQLIKRRLDLKEIFPLWMRLGQMTPPLPLPSSVKGNLRLLRTCAAVVEEERKAEVVSAFTELFLAAFEGMCVPRLLDADYQGLSPYERPEVDDPSPLPILTHSASLIRSLFFKETPDAIALLSCIPPDFHAGRMLEVHTLLGDRIDFEWSKKQLRTICIQPHSERQLRLKLTPRVLRSCRVRTSFKERGKEHAIKDGILSLEISPEIPLFVDRFQK